MATKREATWYSVFGQIEEVVAQQMIQEGKIRRLPIDLTQHGMPHEYNARGERVKLIVSVPPRHIGEFERRIADLYL